MSFHPTQPAQKETYFETPVYLTRTSELHLETLVTGLPQIYSINQAFRPVLRRSKSDAAEFLLLEVARASSATLSQVLDSVEKFCRSLAKTVAEDCKEDLDLILDKEKNRYLDRITKDNQPYFRYLYLILSNLI